MITPLLNIAIHACDTPVTTKGGVKLDVFANQNTLVHAADGGPVVVLSDYSLWCRLHCGFVQKGDLQNTDQSARRAIF